MTRTPALLLLATAFLLGCGERSEVPDTSAPEGGDVPTTARSLAHVAALHAGEPDSASSEDDASEEFAERGIGAELRYGSTGEYDGDVLVVAVGKGLDPALLDCDSGQNEYLDGCAVTEQGTLMWEAVAPEEDPGVVYVAVDKGDAAALLFYAGPAITDDPRELDLPISTDDLFAIANDPRVDLTTSQDAVDAGAALPYWQRIGT